jgi:hypothetical protein
MRAVGKFCEIKIYPDTPAAAKEGWAKMLDWFNKNGAA